MSWRVVIRDGKREAVSSAFGSHAAAADFARDIEASGLSVTRIDGPEDLSDGAQLDLLESQASKLARFGSA